jgi:hypothetical protein
MTMARSAKVSRHATKTKQKKSHAQVKKASVRSAVRTGSFRTVNKPKGW